MQDVTKTAAKKKKFRLEDIVVKTVGLVDTPAVQGSEFLVAKSMGEEEESMQHQGKQGAEDTETLHPRHARAVLSAVHQLEDAAVPFGYEGETAPKMPKAILDHIKGLRSSLRAHLSKAMEEELARQETFEPLNAAEWALVKRWQSFPSERALLAHLDLHEDEAQAFDEIGKRFDAELEAWGAISAAPLPEAREWLDTLDRESRTGMINIIDRGRRGLYD